MENNIKNMEKFSLKKNKTVKQFLIPGIIAVSAGIVCIVSAVLVNNGNNRISDFGRGMYRRLLSEDLPFVSAPQYIYFPSEEAAEKDSQASDKSYVEDLSSAKIIEETGSMKDSKNNEWWLNSGGLFYVGSSQFSTNQGLLSKDSKWRKAYSKSNSEDTDDGYHPQNIFRLVTKSKWDNFSQSVYFNISALNKSSSKNRNESNGVLFFNRYQDGDDLYYAGFRVDGDVVIKKKINGKYYTMAEKNFFENPGGYSRENNPNVIPVNKWIGLKTEIRNNDDRTVNIKLYADADQSGNWKLALETKDSGDKYGDAPIEKKGYAGIRTDFLDVQFKDYRLERL